jgi:hypothetical protein
VKTKPNYWNLEEEPTRKLIRFWGHFGARGRRTSARILRARQAVMAEPLSDEQVLAIAHNRVAFHVAEQAESDGWLHLLRQVPGQELQALQRLAGEKPDPSLKAADAYYVRPDYYRRLHERAGRRGALRTARR